MGKRFVITGCGRSGTLFSSRLFTAAGLRCGHESACQVTGFKGFGDAAGDASWYAAAYLGSLPDDVVVLHQVRHPMSVATSWYRIRLFGPTPLGTVCYGAVSPRSLMQLAASPSAAAARWRYVRDQRQLVERASNVFDSADEAQRCFRYWVEWNRLVERASNRRPLHRFRLEDLGPATWQELGAFLDRDLGPFPQLAPANRKSRYPSRPFPAAEIPAEVRSMAHEYGYDLSSAGGDSGED